MLAMQYRFLFAEDFDMSQIERRIAEKGTAFDNYPGLIQKAFLYNRLDDPLSHHNPGNEYAVFYIWNSDNAARRFLLSPAFAGVSGAFGRPAVRIWQVLSHDTRHCGTQPVFAVRELLDISRDSALTDVVAEEQALRTRLLDRADLLGYSVAFDPERWELLRFSLWREPVADIPPQTGYSYRVLYLARSDA